MLSRRRALQTLALSVSGVIAGCLGRPTTTENSSTPATEDPQPKALELTADILSTASSDAPAQVEATLRNTGTTDIKIYYGPTLVFVNHSEDEKLVLEPESRAGPWSEPTYTNGCWRFPADGEQDVNLIQGFETLSPDDTFTEVYAVYTRSNVEACFPEGMQRFEETITVAEDDTEVTLTLGLEITAEGGLSVDAEETEARIDSSD